MHEGQRLALACRACRTILRRLRAIQHGVDLFAIALLRALSLAADVVGAEPVFQ
jgi:hypothetical protein